MKKDGSSLYTLCLLVYYFIDSYSEKRYNLTKEGTQDPVDIKQLFKFSKSFWYICLLCISFYAAIFPFQTFAVKFFQDVHHTTRDAGGFLSSLLTLTAMFCTPLFGALSDRIGRRSLLMMIGSFLIVPVYLMMGYGFNLVSLLSLPEMIHIKIAFLDIDSFISPNLLVPMMLMGIAFSLIPAVMWPSVALVTEPKRLGTAYGLMTMIQNIGLAGFNLLIGFSNDTFHAGIENPTGYLAGMWIFSICGILGIIFSILLGRSAKTSGAYNLDKAY